MITSFSPFAFLLWHIQTQTDHISYIDNGQIRLGVNLDLGGAITYLSKSESETNLVNSADWGRQIQMSHYSGPVPFKPNGKEPKKEWEGLGWNPIQCGDAFGNRAKLLAVRNDGQSIYVRSIPMQWPLNNEPGECTFECWIKLDGKAVQVHSRMVNNRADHTQYDGRGQELPAVYTNGPWCRLMTYTGDKPFTNDRLEQRPPVFMWTGWKATEHWAALLDDHDFGLGVWNTASTSFIGGFAGKPGKGGPKDSPTGYIAPVTSEIIDHNITYDYRYVLILGQLPEIRQYVYDHAKRPIPPDYRFIRSRNHWVYVGAQDQGWPLIDGLHIKSIGQSSQWIGPDTFWLAKDAPKLVFDAAFDSQTTEVVMAWKRYDSPEFSASKQLKLKLIPDGKLHEYEVNLRESIDYRGVITGVGFIVGSGNGGESHAWVRRIAFRK